MITVMGATGHVGSRITRRVLAAGEPVRAVGRNPQALADLAAPRTTTPTRFSDVVSELLPARQAAP